MDVEKYRYSIDDAVKFFWQTRNNYSYGNIEQSISIDSFNSSFIGHLTGQINEFSK
jgi:hypothetical protein